mmetsp:Transcript_5507/g.16311  ORF Transcript_5507/g.16311 Transcript_5507/m.16311 type:complete len:202 (-) Transcript_5507:125-730(-)
MPRWKVGIAFLVGYESIRGRRRWVWVVPNRPEHLRVSTFNDMRFGHDFLVGAVHEVNVLVQFVLEDHPVDSKRLGVAQLSVVAGVRFEHRHPKAWPCLVGGDGESGQVVSEAPKRNPKVLLLTDCGISNGARELLERRLEVILLFALEKRVCRGCHAHGRDEQGPRHEEPPHADIPRLVLGRIPHFLHFVARVLLRLLAWI